MKRLGKSRTARPHKPSRAIWQGIVDYANANLESDQGAARSLGGLVVYCFNRLGIGGFENVVKIFEIGYGNEERGLTIEESLAYWGSHYQPAFRRLLMWLCDPSKHLELSSQAAQFLQKMIEGLEISVEKPNFVIISGNERIPADPPNLRLYLKYKPLFVLPTLRSCASIMSPIGRFLVDQILRFQDGEISLKEAIPIRVCYRVGCGRFKLPKRYRDLCFCSSRCRSAYHQSKKSREEKNASMRKWRQMQKERSARRKQARPH